MPSLKISTWKRPTRTKRQYEEVDGSVKDVRAQFGKTAAAYVSSATHASGEDLERLVAIAAPRIGERALDLGCGVGHTLRRIAPMVSFAIGADATLGDDAGRARERCERAERRIRPVRRHRSSLRRRDLRPGHLPSGRASLHRRGDRVPRGGARCLGPRGRFVLVDNYAPKIPRWTRSSTSSRRCAMPPTYATTPSRDGFGLLREAGLRPSVESELMTTKLTTEAWLERSQTPADRAAEVRRRLRGASGQARDAFHITDTTFAVPKVVVLARR